MTMLKHVTKNLTAQLIETAPNGDVTIKMADTGEVQKVVAIVFRRWWKKIEGEAIPEAPHISKNKPEQTSETDNKPKTEKSVDEPIKLSEIARKLEDLFDTLNTIYFESKLPRPVITIQSTPRAYGHCSTKQIWKSETEARYEINIGAEFLNRPKENTAATLCHEMVHLYCRENEINETCQKGRYHNKTFKIEAEARDLEIDYDRANGYTHTTPTEIFKKKLENAGFDMSVPFSRHTIIAKKTSEREKPHKYVCATCGQTVRSTGDLKLVCGICDVPMERED